MRHRPAITLIEVLMAIFVMGIGMLALLVLFPLGALSVAQALRDDRAAQAASNASAMANAMDVRHDPLVRQAFSNPFPDIQLPLTWTGPGWPVYVDPLYANRSLPNLPQPLGAFARANTRGIPRRTLSWITAAAAPDRLTTRWFTLLDDITFSSGELANGQPEPGPYVKRGGRYTWAFLVKPWRVSNQEVVDLSVVVYSGRPTLVVPDPPEQAFLAAGNQTGNVITLTYTGEKPAVRKGVWVLDVTQDAARGVPNADFYRVIGVSDSSVPNQLDLEVQGTLKANINAVVLMEQVVEVFDRGSGWKP